MGFVRGISAGLALGLMAGAPVAIGQKMNKCVDASGAITFQQAACPTKPRTPQEEEALQKEQERLQQEKERAKAEEARIKAERAAKIKERDKAYQEKMNQSAEERKRQEEMEARILQGTSREGSAGAGALPTGFETIYPPPWKEETNAGITAALAKNNIKECGQARHRRRSGGADEYLVQCTKDGSKWDTYFVWPQTQAVKGPIK